MRQGMHSARVSVFALAALTACGSSGGTTEAANGDAGSFIDATGALDATSVDASSQRGDSGLEPGGRRRLVQLFAGSERVREEAGRLCRVCGGRQGAGTLLAPRQRAGSAPESVTTAPLEISATPHPRSRTGCISWTSRTARARLRRPRTSSSRRRTLPYCTPLDRARTCRGHRSRMTGSCSSCSCR